MVAYRIGHTTCEMLRRRVYVRYNGMCVYEYHTTTATLTPNAHLVIAQSRDECQQESHAAHALPTYFGG